MLDVDWGPQDWGGYLGANLVAKGMGTYSQTVVKVAGAC
jgi:hypothetical protein